MKCELYPDEWYPVYVINDGDSHEVPDDLIARWQRCREEFNEIQREFSAIDEATR